MLEAVSQECLISFRLRFTVEVGTLGITFESPANAQLTGFVTKSNTPFFLGQRPEKFFEDKLDQSLLLLEVLF